MTREWYESELEDWVWGNLESIAEQCLIPDLFSYAYTHPILRLGRQVRCQTGIIDILASCFTGVFAIELKATKAGTKELGQVTRYAENIEKALCGPSISKVLPNCGDYYYLHSDVIVYKVLIAPSFDDCLYGAKNDTTSLLIANKTEDGFKLSPLYRDESIYVDSDIVTALTPFVQLMDDLGGQKRAFDRQRQTEERQTAVSDFVKAGLFGTN